MQPDPEPPAQQPWITKPLRGGQVLGAHRRTLDEKKKSSSGVYHVLSDDNSPDQENSEPLSTEQKPPPTTIDLTKEDKAQSKSSKPVKLTADDLARKKDAKSRGKVKILTGPVLMTKRRQERATFQAQRERVDISTQRPLRLGARSAEPPDSFADIEHQLGVREIATPDTGNCLAMAVAQAAVNATLDGPSSALEPLTASVKRGIKYADLLHLEDQLVHDMRWTMSRERGQT
ncbi:hypothetical protein PC128_g1088 [Phytophthora cactorum]|nr:hypothetical protein PC128_g1088 [Phytophthora cactorum]